MLRKHHGPDKVGHMHVSEVRNNYLPWGWNPRRPHRYSGLVLI